MFQFVPQRADGDTENVGRRGAVAHGVFQGINNQVALHAGNRAADKFSTGHFCSGNGINDGINIVQQNCILIDFIAATQQHCPVDGIFQLADVARPKVVQQLLLGGRGHFFQRNIV